MGCFYDACLLALPTRKHFKGDRIMIDHYHYSLSLIRTTTIQVLIDHYNLVITLKPGWLNNTIPGKRSRDGDHPTKAHHYEKLGKQKSQRQWLMG